MKKLSIQRKSLNTEYGKYHCVYELLRFHYDDEEGEEGKGTFFGIRISQFREDGTLFDQDEALGITEDCEEAERLFWQYVDGVVLPVHLAELIDDRNCALQSL